MGDKEMKHILKCPYCKKRVPIKFLSNHRNNCKLWGNKEVELLSVSSDLNSIEAYR